MKLLAIETSTDACSVALSIDQAVKIDHRIAPQQHSKLVLPMIDALMASAELKPSDLDGVVFGQGPGSFTGVRIAASVTQGIALGADVGVLGISTLQALAQGCAREYGDTHVVAAFDARMSEVYWGAFAVSDDGLMRLSAHESVCKPDTLRLPISLSSEKWCWAGSGVDRYPAEFSAAASYLHDAPSSITVRLDRLPHAQDLLLLAEPMINAGQMQPAEHAVPVYLRDRVALTEGERARGEKL